MQHEKLIRMVVKSGSKCMKRIWRNQLCFVEGAYSTALFHTWAAARKIYSHFMPHMYTNYMTFITGREMECGEKGILVLMTLGDGVMGLFL